MYTCVCVQKCSRPVCIPWYSAPCQPGNTMAVCRAEPDGFTGWLHQLGLQRFAPNCSERREAGVIKDHPSTMSDHCLSILQVCFRRLKIVVHKLARRKAEKAQQP